MRLSEQRRSVDRELAVIEDRLQAAQRDAVAAMTAVGAIASVLAVLGGWMVI